MARANRLINWSFWCLTLSVALLPIGLGGDRPIPLGMAQMGLAFSSLFLAACDDFWLHLRFLKRLRPAFWLFGIVIIWAFFQVQPFVPASWVHPLWAEAAAALKVPVNGSIAVAPEDALKGVTRLITYIAAGLLAYVLTQDPKRAKQLVRFIWYTGVAICIYGLLLYIVNSQTILWYDKWAYEDDLTATFVNRNHFAIYAGMIFVTGLAFLAQSFSHDIMHKRSYHRIQAFKDWLGRRGLPQGFLLAIVFLCILLSHSRAGFVMTLIGIASYVFFYQIYQKAYRRAAVMAIVSVIFIVLALCVAVEFADRFSTLFVDYSSLDRIKVWKLAIHALQDNPWFGYGMNGFEPEFRIYQQNMLMEFNHAHSDVLESLFDLGIPVGLMLWAAIGVLLTGLWRGIHRRRQNGLYPVLGLAASIMLIGHAFVDFSMQIPGDVMTWAALMGAGLAQSKSRNQTVE